MTQSTSATSLQVKLLDRLATRYSTDGVSLYRTLKETVFHGASDAELQALCVVAYTYDLNPFTKEIYAFPAKGGGIVPVVGVDGYIKTMNANPQFDGLEFAYSDTIAKMSPGPRKPCPEWVEIRIYRKDRSRPTVVREYLDECFRNTLPWQDHPRRMLRHKAIAQGVRLAFGFGGVIDEDDAATLVQVDVDGLHGSGQQVLPEPGGIDELNARISALAEAPRGEVIEANGGSDHETGVATAETELGSENIN